MFDYGLSTQQIAVICALSNGATMTAAAQEAGIHRNTLDNWRRNLMPFQQALAQAQYDRALYFREKIEELADLAVKTIQDILADPKTTAGVRLKAALAIMQTACTPPLPKKQILLDIEKIKINPNPAEITEDQFAKAPEPTPENPPNLHKNAQPIPNIRANSSSFVANPPQVMHNSAQRTPRIGRNDTCSCGSGLKYKRCCLNKPQAMSA